MQIEQAVRLMETADASATATIALFEAYAAYQKHELSVEDAITVANDYVTAQREFENARNTYGIV